MSALAWNQSMIDSIVRNGRDRGSTNNSACPVFRFHELAYHSTIRQKALNRLNIPCEVLCIKLVRTGIVVHFHEISGSIITESVTAPVASDEIFIPIKLSPGRLYLTFPFNGYAQSRFRKFAVFVLPAITTYLNVCPFVSWPTCFPF